EVVFICPRQPIHYLGHVWNWMWRAGGGDRSRRNRRREVIVERRIGPVRAGIGDRIAPIKIEQSDGAFQIGRVVAPQRHQGIGQVIQIVNLRGEITSHRRQNQTVKPARLQGEVGRGQGGIDRRLVRNGIDLNLTPTAGALLRVVVQDVTGGRTWPDIAGAENQSKRLVQGVVPGRQIHCGVKIIVAVGAGRRRASRAETRVGGRRALNEVSLSAAIIVGRKRERGGAERGVAV